MSRRTLTIEQWNEEGVRRFGKPARKWLFLCPSCKTVQSGEDFFATGMVKDEVLQYLAYSCIGRFSRSKGCDWTLGGLFHIHDLEVIDEDGKPHPRFEFAELLAQPGHEDKPVVKIRTASKEDEPAGKILVRSQVNGAEFWIDPAGYVDVVPESGVAA